MAQPFSIAHGGKFVGNDNGLPVSVVGSLPNITVLIPKTVSPTVNAGAFYHPAARIDVSNYQSVIIGVTPDVTHNYMSSANQVDYASGFVLSNTDLALIGGASQGKVLSAPKAVPCTALDPYVYNLDTVAHTYTVVFYGVGGR